MSLFLATFLFLVETKIPFIAKRFPRYECLCLRQESQMIDCCPAVGGVEVLAPSFFSLSKAKEKTTEQKLVLSIAFCGNVDERG